MKLRSAAASASSCNRSVGHQKQGARQASLSDLASLDNVAVRRHHVLRAWEAVQYLQPVVDLMEDGVNLHSWKNKVMQSNTYA